MKPVVSSLKSPSSLRRAWSSGTEALGVTVLLLPLGVAPRLSAASPPPLSPLPEACRSDELPAAAATTSDAVLAELVNREANALLRGGRVAGIAVGVLRAGVPAFAGGFGFADLEHSVPVTPDTFFRLASVSKQFTAAALLQQVEDGKLALEDPLSRHFPLLRAPGGDPTLRQLLNHTSGLMSLTSVPDFRRRMALAQSVADVVAMFDGAAADFAPGDGFAYNNSAYILAGEIAARAAGNDYPTLVRTRLFEPLGMKSSGYAHEDRLIPHRARGYAVADGKLVPASWMNREVPRGAGSLGSTVSDLLIWARALPELEVVGDASFAAMVEPTALPAPGRDDAFDVVSYGLGLALGERDGVPWYGHGGNIEGFNTWIEWLPDDDLALVALVNTEGDHAHTLCERLARRLAKPRTAAAATTAPAAPAEPFDAALRERCVGRYVSGSQSLRLRLSGDALELELDGAGATRLAWRGRRDGRFEFGITADPSESFCIDLETTPPRATLAGRMALRRFIRSE